MRGSGIECILTSCRWERPEGSYLLQFDVDPLLFKALMGRGNRDLGVVGIGNAKSSKGGLKEGYRVLAMHRSPSFFPTGLSDHS